MSDWNDTLIGAFEESRGKLAHALARADCAEARAEASEATRKAAYTVVTAAYGRGLRGGGWVAPEAWLGHLMDILSERSST